jgi:SAM-dependent methyltransferase
VVGDLETLGFPRESFDVIWAAAILHHIDEKVIQTLLERSLQWLKPGGYLLSIDPSSRRLISLFKRLVRAKYLRYHSPDERELNPETLCDMFRRAGFTDICLLYPDYFLNPLSWLYPALPAPLVRVASLFDALLLRLPLVNRYASSFTLIAHR